MTLNGGKSAYGDSGNVSLGSGVASSGVGGSVMVGVCSVNDLGLVDLVWWARVFLLNVDGVVWFHARSFIF